MASVFILVSLQSQKKNEASAKKTDPNDTLQAGSPEWGTQMAGIPSLRSVFYGGWGGGRGGGESPNKPQIRP